jgi:hypothetical protein
LNIFRDQAHRLSQAITTNPNNVLKRLDISKNNIEEKGELNESITFNKYEIIHLKKQNNLETLFSLYF